MMNRLALRNCVAILISIARYELSQLHTLMLRGVKSSSSVSVLEQHGRFRPPQPEPFLYTLVLYLSWSLPKSLPSPHGLSLAD
jgi:hypothetical protein